MQVREINFDGLVGPLHNYAGLSLGNVASASNAGGTSHPRAAALQGLAKMRTLLDRGLAQGFLPPLRRPAIDALRALGFAGTDQEVLRQTAHEDPALFNNACSASSMWTANAATVIAAADARDGRVHLVTANLDTMLHRSLEAAETFSNLRRVFADQRHFAVHAPLAPGRHLSDEGAANHMRIAAHHGAAGLNIFVHGEERGGRFPERQCRRAGEAVARLAGLNEGGALHIRQSAAAIAAGAFHNDVVAVANESVLLAHPQAFDEDARAFARIAEHMPDAHLIAVEGVSLESAVRSYLFNSQLVTLEPGAMALVLPSEVNRDPDVKAAIDRLLAADNPIAEAIIVDVRESMRNGGGPACLRLRVPASEAAVAGIGPAFLLDERRWDALVRLVETWWTETIPAEDLHHPDLWAAVAAAHDALDAHLAKG
ncbi:MAG: N-succinylarginine dihydrolase [Sphingobium sp.]